MRKEEHDGGVVASPPGRFNVDTQVEPNYPLPAWTTTRLLVVEAVRRPVGVGRVSRVDRREIEGIGVLATRVQSKPSALMIDG